MKFSQAPEYHQHFHENSHSLEQFKNKAGKTLILKYADTMKMIKAVKKKLKFFVRKKKKKEEEIQDPFFHLPRHANAICANPSSSPLLRPYHLGWRRSSYRRMIRLPSRSGFPVVK
ncbi:hypothetical protein Nepgr_026297 [Nepenthes gracilis]|uniref:Uncharacterized protein n=1 Tax=Nepenthes gracilis TaxID=150966 RepID=A0AAD3T8U0_NEPGR|nr:hypothetical protein Nepgr_026297 [Nepenthes gracilis]